MFFTSVEVGKFPFTIGLGHSIMTTGSCFAECMGNKFEENKFKTLASPFGTVYNPISLSRQLHMALDDQKPVTSEIVHTNDVSFHYHFHSQFAGIDDHQLLDTLAQRISETGKFLANANFLIITWGTAWIYEKEEEVVANCHKQPQALFNKRLLSQEEIKSDFKKFYDKLKTLNPAIKLILTLSPVRHLKDTLELNAVSKSLLRHTIYNIVENSDDTYYFPAYEIMTDELRDYRFYKEDMIHPTPQAEDIIWKKFTEASFNDETLQLLSEWASIRKSMNHKAFNPNSTAHQKFLINLLGKIDKLNDKMDLSEELERVKKMIL